MPANSAKLQLQLERKTVEQPLLIATRGMPPIIQLAGIIADIGPPSVSPPQLHADDAWTTHGLLAIAGSLLDLDKVDMATCRHATMHPTPRIAIATITP
jgi:hypothetical protein